MPLIDQIREKALIELAKARFAPDLSDAEKKVLRDSASSEELPEPDEKAPRPVIRADFLRWLATDPEAAPHIDPKGLRVYAATIPGKLDLEECRVNPTLEFQCCNFQGVLSLQSTETRSLYFFDSSLAGGMQADGVIVHGVLFLRRIQSESEIRLIGARIENNLDCSGAKLKAKGNALIADGAKIGGNVFLTDRFESEGEIRLLGADITGQLVCNGAKLKAKGNALIADGAKIGGGVFLRDNFESEGEVRLLDAKIEGELSCSGAKLKAKGNALHADRAQIGGSVFLTNGFESEGEIRLIGAEIGGNLSIRGAKVAKVFCRNAVVKGDLDWQRIEKSEDTTLSLIGVRVKNLHDDRMSWPEEGKLYLDGLVYEELTLHTPSSDEDIKNSRYSSELPRRAQDRIAWLELQSQEDTAAQPWVQLVSLLNASGDPEGAREVLYEYQRRSRGRNVLWRAGTYPLDQLEQWPLEIWAPIASLGLIGSLIFWRAYRMKMMAPTEKEAFEEFQKSGTPLQRYIPFNPVIYAIENVLPVVNLGQDSAWRPNPQAAPGSWLPDRPKWLKSNAERWAITRWIFRLNCGRLAALRWSLILLGWALALILAGAIGGIFKP